MPNKTIHFVSLGCPKNRVDSEVMLGVAQRMGYRLVAEATAADVIVVNTCGFIEPAKKESIDVILEMAEHRRDGACRQLVVAGCLSQGHADELARELPEVDHFLGSSDMLRMAEVLRGAADRMLVGDPAEWLIGADSPRALSSSPGSAYLKLAEGCDRSCSFCVIPQLRGKQRSRPLQDVIREAEQLAQQGVKELNLIAQDSAAYGRDLERPVPLSELLERVADVSGVRWVRLFYLYPERLDERLVELLADHPRVLPYVDMPLQHAADAMLRRMRRGHRKALMRQLIEQLRARVDELTFRTAFIVGHPGETQAEFDELCELVRWAEFERVGVFCYSDEERAPSHGLDGKVDPGLAAERHAQLMEIAQTISRRKNATLVGRRLEVLVEGTSDEHELVQMGRHMGQAPEIDGQVYLSGTEQLERPLAAGQLVSVRVTQASDYDLAGNVESAPAAGQDRPPRRVSLPVIGARSRSSD